MLFPKASFLVLLLLLLPSLLAQQNCAKCHAQQALAQPQTPMANAMQPPSDNPTLKAHPKLTFQKGPYTFLVETLNGQTTYSVSEGARTISVPVKWTFGAGNQTWVLERNGQFYESLVSYYLSVNGLSITTGDEKLEPHSLEEALGRKLELRETKACFNCHATNAVHDDELTLETVHPGVSCERCHQGSSAHLASLMPGKKIIMPPSLDSMNSEDISGFCGQCHRTWETVIRSRYQGPIDVRFQPYRLANSKCFDGTDRRISCLACHDPHQPLVQEESYYDAKCLACHAPSVKAAHNKSCPVASAKCVSCHMPRVTLPNGLLNFADHEIRIVRQNEPYPD